MLPSGAAISWKGGHSISRQVPPSIYVRLRSPLHEDLHHQLIIIGCRNGRVPEVSLGTYGDREFERQGEQSTNSTCSDSQQRRFSYHDAADWSYSDFMSHILFCKT